MPNILVLNQLVGLKSDMFPPSAERSVSGSVQVLRVEAISRQGTEAEEGGGNCSRILCPLLQFLIIIWLFPR